MDCPHHYDGWRKSIGRARPPRSRSASAPLGPWKVFVVMNIAYRVGLRVMAKFGRWLRVTCAGLLAVGASLSIAHAGDQTVRASLNTELQSLDPVYASVNATRVFSYLVFDTLIAIDNEGKYHPQMLEGWEISPDRMSYRFRLRDGLTWSDGTPVTAEDCVASIQRWAKRESFGGQLIEATQEFRVINAT